ncbi:hypothetical protein ArV2_gp23 [Arthrobacter phage vB_ArS-ArV2]|uniref:Uncharacterized protein n=1 Tax=Arthrobacter phage vB_ArS-ArV2 TaxID=1414742 RepID=V5R8Z8_9CAUD|nr:hypothetical protein ArV2_gp23 [Arthrobacter phage vB_ArS-ArV2]AHB31633.1 hypothetical protein ArV2_gp23 [Arthrobacter phage vB_ArS-ArV2]
MWALFLCPEGDTHMADYPYDGQLIADPVTFQRATNAQITVYDAADTGNTTKLALKDTSGLPLANPLTSTADAFTVPFYAPSQDIKLVGAGLTVFVSSAKGMRDAAAAAAAAAQAAASNAATEAAAGVASVVSAAASAKTAAETAAASAASAAALVNAPADAAIEAAILGAGTKTKAALSATYVVFRNHDGTPVAAPKVVAITLTADGADIDNIAVYNSLEEVGS